MTDPSSAMTAPVPSRARSPRRPKPAAWRRWCGILLRSGHLAAVSWLAVALHVRAAVASLSEQLPASLSGLMAGSLARLLEGLSGRFTPGWIVAVPAAGAAVLLSGALLLALELADRRVRLDELAGGFVLVKLALVGLMAWQPGWALPLFWGVLLASSISSHAPRDLRHWPGVAPAKGGGGRPVDD
jgi:hypothetical protein